VALKNFLSDLLAEKIYMLTTLMLSKDFRRDNTGVVSPLREIAPG